MRAQSVLKSSTLAQLDVVFDPLRFPEFLRFLQNFFVVRAAHEVAVSEDVSEEICLFMSLLTFQCSLINLASHVEVRIDLVVKLCDLVVVAIGVSLASFDHFIFLYLI